MRMGKLGCFDDFLIRRIRAPIADIIGNGAFKQVRLLRDIGDGMAQRVLFDVFNVLPVEQYPAFVEIVEALDKVDERGLTCAGCANHGSGFTRLGDEADAMQHRRGFTIGEINILETNFSGTGFQLYRVRNIALMRLYIQHFVDHARIDKRPLQPDLKAGKAAGWVIGEQHCGDEGKGCAGWLLVKYGTVAAIGQHARYGKAGQHFSNGRRALGNLGDLVAAPFRLVDEVADLVA